MKILNIYKDGDNFIVAEKGKIPKYIRLAPCQECGHPHYSLVRFKLIGQWEGRFTEATGKFLAGIMKVGFKE